MEVKTMNKVLVVIIFLFGFALGFFFGWYALLGMIFGW